MSPSPVEDSPPQASAVRLQKVLARAGLGSRRACEELIAAGRVTVNGLLADLGVRVDAERDVIRVDGAVVPTATGLVYLAVHKPAGVLSAMTSTPGRPCVGDLVAPYGAGLHHVGRLDADSEGLLLVTNDGALSHRLTHPSYGVPKRYLAEVDGHLRRSALALLRAGVELEDGPARADDVRVLAARAAGSLVEIEVHEGRNRLVRRMLEAVDHPVRRLVRLSVGPIRLGELRPGRVRHLGQPEVRALYAVVEDDTAT